MTKREKENTVPEKVGGDSILTLNRRGTGKGWWRRDVEVNGHAGKSVDWRLRSGEFLTVDDLYFICRAGYEMSA